MGETSLSEDKGISLVVSNMLTVPLNVLTLCMHLSKRGDKKVMRIWSTIVNTLDKILQYENSSILFKIHGFMWSTLTLNVVGYNYNITINRYFAYI